MVLHGLDFKAAFTLGKTCKMVLELISTVTHYWYRILSWTFTVLPWNKMYRWSGNEPFGAVIWSSFYQINDPFPTTCVRDTWPSSISVLHRGNICTTSLALPSKQYEKGRKRKLIGQRQTDNNASYRSCSSLNSRNFGQYLPGSSTSWVAFELSWSLTISPLFRLLQPSVSKSGSMLWRTTTYLDILHYCCTGGPPAVHRYVEGGIICRRKSTTRSQKQV